VSALCSLAAANDLEELRRLVHQLKGAGAGFGFPKIAECAAQTESLIKSSADLASLQAGVDELVELMRNIRGYDRSAETIALPSSRERGKDAAPQSKLL
jgi:HPt (histidine-containing phosphotransfer) domain-containing protein